MGKRPWDENEIARALTEDSVGDVTSPLLAYLTSLPMGGPSRIARTTAANASSSHARPALDSPSSPGLRFLAGPLAGTVGLHFSAFITANVLGAVV